MSAMASQITSLMTVYSTVYSRHISKKTSKLRVTGLWMGNSPGTGEFPAQMASNAENVSIWWRHHDVLTIEFQWGPGNTSGNPDRFVYMEETAKPQHYLALPTGWGLLTPPCHDWWTALYKPYLIWSVNNEEVIAHLDKPAFDFNVSFVELVLTSSTLNSHRSENSRGLDVCFHALIIH